MVSASGAVRSLDRVVYRSDTGTPTFHKGKVLVAIPDERGYLRLRLSVNRKKTSKRVHQMVAEAFIQNPENKIQVNHIDGIKTNNCLSNLEWLTNGENQIHAIENGLKIIHFGKKAIRFERTVEAYKDGKLFAVMSGNEEMRRQGFDYRLVSACLMGKRKTHRGCTFKAIPKED